MENRVASCPVREIQLAGFAQQPRQVDFIRLIDRVAADPDHHGAKGLKIIGDCLSDEDIAVSQKKHALHCASHLQPPDKACLILGLDRPSSQLSPEPWAAET